MSAPRFYAIQLAKNGPRVGLKLWNGYPIDPLTGETLTERPKFWRCELNGEYANAVDIVPWIVDGTSDSVRGDKITEAEYEHLSSVAKWAMEYDPEDPYAKPREAIDMNKIAPIKW